MVKQSFRMCAGKKERCMRQSPLVCILLTRQSLGGGRPYKNECSVYLLGVKEAVLVPLRVLISLKTSLLGH